jgi:hypothetical protein
MGIIGGEEKALRKDLGTNVAYFIQLQEKKANLIRGTLNKDQAAALEKLTPEDMQFSEEELHIFWGQLFQCCRLIFI